jgi:glucose/arabinose dehydrogenase
MRLDRPNVRPVVGSRTRPCVAAFALALLGLLAACTEPAEDAGCVAPERPLDLFLEVVEAFPDLPRFEQPVGLAQTPSMPTRFFVLEKTGRVRSFDTSATDQGVNLVVDLHERLDTRKECGLVGMAFHPAFERTSEVLLSYCFKGEPTLLRIARFRYDVAAQAIDVESERVILELPTPRHIHHSGQLRFDQDGYLVTSIGDTGPQGDPDGVAQNTDDLPGSFLRLDVDSAEPYAIPADNPFADEGALAGMGRPELYAWGFRNPWSFSFDRETHALWAGDVGHNEVEEIDLVEPGHNYGWAAVEGDLCIEPSCKTRGFTGPVATFENRGDSAVIGGYVYRGRAIEGLRGVYVFADFDGGEMWGIFDPYGRPQQRVIFPSTGITPSSFYEDLDGELYMTDLGGGRIEKLVPSERRVRGTFPQTLSESGCVRFDREGKPEPAGGAVPYDVHMPLWSDGADKTRYVSVNGAKTVITETGDVEFPIGTVLVKLFEREGALVEGRLLVRHADGRWGGYSYAWDPKQNDATLLEEGKTQQIGGRPWIYPSRDDCFTCHTSPSGYALGPELSQLTDLDGLVDQGVLERGAVTSTRTLADRDDDAATLDAWVRSYLQANCASCHRPGGTADADIDLRYLVDGDHALTLGEMRMCDALPVGGDLGVEGARILVPGDAERSVLYLRMAQLGKQHMPPLSTMEVDTLALQQLKRWIDAITACP